MFITPFTENFRTQVIDLWRACDLIVPQNDPDKDIDRKLKVDPELFLVGLLGRTVVATAMGGYDGHRGWIYYLAVDPEFQGKGLGTEILSAIEAKLRERGCPKINLQIRTSNSAVANFYESLGFSDDNVLSLGKRLSD